MVSSTYDYSQTLMGMTVTLTLLEQNETVAKLAFATIKLLEDKLTVNRPVSEVMSINLAAGKHPVEVSLPVFSLIKQARQLSVNPSSCFNMAIGPVVKLWKIGFKGDSIPADHHIKQQLLLTDPFDIELNDTTHSVFLKKAGMEIDLGAIAKGYIADVIKNLLLEHHIHHGIINLGGNVLTLGASPIEKSGCWCIGLRKPFSLSDELAGIIKVKNKSVVTSGIYERYFVQNNRLYHHIFNPLTGYPLDNEIESVTVISNTSLEGDIYSTIFYGLGVNASGEYLKKHPDISAIFLLKNKTMTLINPKNFNFDLIDKHYEINLH